MGSIIQKGISKDDVNSPRYFDGKYIIPYDKGGESDSDEGWLPNYYVPTNYFIDWSEGVVWFLFNQKCMTTKSAKPYFRNYESYFLDGLCYSRVGIYSPSFRWNNTYLFDVNGCKLFSTVDYSYLLGILCSVLIKMYIKSFITHTVSSQVDEIKEIPIVITEEKSIKDLTKSIMVNQKINNKYDYSINEQIEIDRIIYESYGLNEEDIEEVENWYARRYPKLVEAQKRKMKVISILN